MVKSNIRDVQRGIRNKKILLSESVYKDVTFAALQTGIALMKRRIFNEGRDAYGKLFGRYISEPYREKRAKHGRQIGKKDLQLEGGLFLDIQTQKVTGGARSEIRFMTQENANIGMYQEQQIANIRTGILPVKVVKGKKAAKRKAPPLIIFALNTKEKSEVNRVGRALLKQVLAK